MIIKYLDNGEMPSEEVVVEAKTEKIRTCIIGNRRKIAFIKAGEKEETIIEVYDVLSIAD